MVRKAQTDLQLVSLLPHLLQLSIRLANLWLLPVPTHEYLLMKTNAAKTIHLISERSTNQLETIQNKQSRQNFTKPNETVRKGSKNGRGSSPDLKNERGIRRRGKKTGPAMAQASVQHLYEEEERDRARDG